MHSLTAGSNYQNYHITTDTPITFDEAFDCRFLLGPYGDLFYVKVASAATRRMEVFSRTAISNYQTMHVTSSTSLPMNPQKAAFGLFRDSQGIKLMCVRKSVPRGHRSWQLTVAVAGFS